MVFKCKSFHEYIRVSEETRSSKIYFHDNSPEVTSSDLNFCPDLGLKKMLTKTFTYKEPATQNMSPIYLIKDSQTSSQQLQVTSEQP